MKRVNVLGANVLFMSGLLIAACADSASVNHDVVDKSSGTVSYMVPSPAGNAVVQIIDSDTLLRSDGLNGAEVPPPSVTSAVFEKHLVDDSAGRFPSLDFPSVVLASDADWIMEEDLVLGAVQNGSARAYPLFMMRFHHVSNDELGGGPYLVTF